MNRLDRSIIKTMPDGTVKQVNPFTGTEVWIIPGRKNRPIFTSIPENAEKISPKIVEKCNFCPGNYFNTPPEKSRLIYENGKYIFQDRLSPEDVKSRTAAFRRIPNLFEIVTINYWKKNFNYRLSKKNKEWKTRYLTSDLGREHVNAILDLKMKYAGLSEQERKSVSWDEKVEMADAFFGGNHELVIPYRHFIDGAEYNTQLASSGELTPEEHFHYFHFTIQATQDIHENNRYVRYISVYQNWRRQAGASFDHLHKQLVALDEWGVSVEHELELAAKNPNMYNEYAANFASYNNYVICENDYALAFADIGHRHPTIAIYSKSVNCRPSEHSSEELRGFSDIVHGIHAAMGAAISCNEEWYYMPRDSVIPMPWHVLIKWRINIPAGFEGGTKIYVNPMFPEDVRDQVVRRLFELREDGKIADMKIAEECPVKPNSLQYYRSRLT